MQNWMKGKNQLPFDTGLRNEPKIQESVIKPMVLGWGRRIIEYKPNAFKPNGKTETYWLPPGKDNKPDWNHRHLRSLVEIQKYCK